MGNTVKNGILTDQQIHRSIYVSVFLALLLPPFLGGTVMGLVGFYPLPEFYYVFTSYGGMYVALVLVIMLMLVPHLYRGLINLANMETHTAQARAQKVFRRLPLYLLLCVTTYSIFGVLSADFSLEHMGYADYSFKDHLYNQFGLIPVVLITSFPIFFYFVDRLGRYLGPRGIAMTAIPLWTKLLMLGIVTPLLIDSVLLAYYYNRTGYFQFETLVLWVSLLILAAGGTWLAWRSLQQSIKPLESFLASSYDRLIEDSQTNLMPFSLDELGILTGRFGQLIKKQHQLTKSLQDAEALANAVVDNASALVVVLDHDGRIVRFNQACETISGYNFAEIKGKFPWDILLPPEDAEMIRSQAFEVLAKTPENLEGHYTNFWVTKTGEHRLIDWHNSVLLNKDGSMHYMVSVGIDITERKEAEEALQRSQKMDALGKLTGGIAHDYNNMLGIVLGYSELLHTSLQNDPKLSMYVQQIQHAGERGAKLTEKLLAFTRQKIPDAEKLNINSLLLDKQHMLEKTLTARIKLYLDLDHTLWPVWLDSGDLEDTIINLSINASHAIDGNGEITFQTRNHFINTSEADMLQTEPGEYVLLAIKDNGCGMDEITKEKIFEPFFSTKGDKGTGLGLSQVYGFVERSDGVIRVESKLNQGTTFFLYFPRYQSNDSDISLT